MATPARSPTTFSAETYLPQAAYARIVETRINLPDAAEQAAKQRRRRRALAPDGKLAILAADHPARMVLRVGDDPLAMANRWTLLARILRVLTSGQFDGVMGTPDIIDDLLILHYMDRDADGPGFLDDKVMIGCMNRGGLAGAAFELDDRMTGFTAARIAEMQLDGAKMMFRLDPADPASLETIGYCVRAIDECTGVGIPVFLEALMVERTSAGVKVVKTPDALVKVVGVASALGASSLTTWLKIPYCDRFEVVAAATTLPILMLGGESTGDPRGLFTEFVRGMAAGATVRGALVGRYVTFPGAEDPRAVAQAVHGIVHDGWDADRAAGHLAEASGQELDRFAHLG